MNPFDQLVRAIALSEHLIQRLKQAQAIRTPAVEAAFRAVSRHQFLPGIALEEAYADQVVILKEAEGVVESSASMPMVVATMLEALDLQPGQRVLEIGSGAGYNAALISELVGDQGAVVTVEIDGPIAEQARVNLQSAGYGGIRVIEGDGAAGFPDASPYDRISITVGLPGIPWALIEQMTSTGGLVLPVWIQGLELVIAFDRAGDALHSRVIRQYSFVRLQGSGAAGEGWAVSKAIDGLRVTRNPHEQVDSLQAVEHLLNGPFTEMPLSLALSEEALADGLLPWIALHDAETRLMMAEGDAASTGTLPCLIGESGKFHETVGLLSSGSGGVLALLTADFVEETTDHPISIRRYGNDQGLAARLRSHIDAWDAHGRPTLEHLRVNAARTGSGTSLRCRWESASQGEPHEVEIVGVP